MDNCREEEKKVEKTKELDKKVEDQPSEHEKVGQHPEHEKENEEVCGFDIFYFHSFIFRSIVYQFHSLKKYLLLLKNGLNTE